MMEIVFATNNENKIREIAQLLGDRFIVKTLKQIGCEEELEETQTTLQGNSHQKASYVAENYGVSCFADDTGLEIEALDGEPGVYSARYAGAKRSSEDNMDKVLTKLDGNSNRKAQFRTSICLVLNNQTHYFEGICSGEITTSRAGREGFGYDPIFRPTGKDETFAEMSKEDKNAISHRGIAVRKMVEWLKKNA